MADEEGSGSEDELLEDEWPDDFFDDNNAVEDFNDLETVNMGVIKANALAKANSEYPIIEGKAAFKHLPPSVVARIFERLGLQDRIAASRISKYMHEAMGKSEWRSMGDGVLEVSTVMTKFGLEEVTIYLCGLKELHYTLAKDWMYDPTAKPVGQHEFSQLKKLFGKLHLKELRLNNVPLKNSRFQPMTTFIEEVCTFDKLSLLIISKDIYAEITQLLIARARKEVVLEIGVDTLSAEQVMAIQRPVTFRFNQANWTKQSYRNLLNYRDVPLYRHPSQEFFTDMLFMELVLRGHSVIGFNTMLRSVECVTMVIETVSASERPQKIDVKGLNYGICKEFVQTFNATPAPLPDSPTGALPPSEGTEMQAFKHLEATIVLNQRQTGSNEGRLIVTSENYREEEMRTAPRHVYH